MNRYYNPVRTLEGPGSLSSLPEILNGMEPDSKRILLLVWSEEVLKNPAFSFLLDQKSGFQTRPFSFRLPILRWSSCLKPMKPQRSSPLPL